MGSPIERSSTPDVWLCCPVMMHALDGVLIAFVQKAFSIIIPSLPMRSIVGVGLRGASRLPYAPIACEVWSSDIINMMLGCLADILLAIDIAEIASIGYLITLLSLSLDGFRMYNISIYIVVAECYLWLFIFALNLYR